MKASPLSDEMYINQVTSRGKDSMRWVENHVGSSPLERDTTPHHPLLSNTSPYTLLLTVQDVLYTTHNNTLTHLIKHPFSNAHSATLLQQITTLDAGN